MKAHLVALAMGLLWPAASMAHEDYAWVRNPKFLTKHNSHCCSEAHCQPAQTGELVPIPGGWLHTPTGTSIHYGEPGIYPSEDPAGRIFRCVINNVLVCVFEGVSG